MRSAVTSSFEFGRVDSNSFTEATPRIETVLIADLNLKFLKKLRAKEGACNLKGRRTDLCKLEWLN